MKISINLDEVQYKIIQDAYYKWCSFWASLDGCYKKPDDLTFDAFCSYCLEGVAERYVENHKLDLELL